ncbi:MAG: guanylate kinase [Anaerolineae bacterium]|nr:guanylate kinase [Anaerolineae bacterium]
MTNQTSFEHPTHPLLIVVSGPAGVGKDALVKELRKVGPPLHFVITATDRAPRHNETHGVDYFFISAAEFLQMEREGELLEHALVYDQHKGVPKQQVREAMASGKDVIMRVDVQGAATVRRIAPDAVLVFLAASAEDLKRRMEHRASDSPEQVAIRTDKLQEELGYLSIFDYIVFNHHNQLDHAVGQVIAIIQAEHCRVHPRKVEL